MHRVLTVCLYLLLVFAGAARGEIVIDWAVVDKPGNAPNVTSFDGVISSGGAVGYSYSIAKNDVTVSQYVDFLNAKDPTAANVLGLWNANLIGKFGDISLNLNSPVGARFSVSPGIEPLYPVANVSWYSAARFANWLTNGQGDGDTETGSYTLLGGTPIPSNADTLTRNSNAKVVLPTADEWYKAAFFNPKTGSYFLYPTSSNTVPVASAPSSLPNHANYDDGSVNAVETRTPVGSYSGTTSPFGLFDMAGNLFQWTEGEPNSSGVGLVRGSYYELTPDYLVNSFPWDLISRGDDRSLSPILTIGFRVALVPEPSSLALAALGFAGLLAFGWRRRKALR